MIFQFSCPNGHVLSTDDTQQGYECTCPQCQVVFLIPYLQTAEVPAAPVKTTAPSAPARGENVAPAATKKSEPDAFGGGQNNLGDLLGGGGGQSVLGDLLGGGGGLGGPGDLLSESIVHMIPCPKCKNVLETPDNMLDQEAVCPYCNKQFFLRYANSIEAVEKREHEQAIIDARRGEIWLRLAIGFAVIVVIGLIVKMIW